MAETFDYEEMIAVCKELVTEFGEPIKILKFKDTVGAMPWRPGAANVFTYTTVGVFLPNGIRGPFTLARKRGEDVTSGDLVGYIPGDLFGPTDFTTRMLLTDILIRADGTEFAMGTMDYLWPGGKRPTYYEIRVKR